MNSLLFMNSLLTFWLMLLTAFPSMAISLDIRTLGAREEGLSTRSIQHAIDSCHEAGGGTVVIPSGTFTTGTLVLKSYVTLHLEQGAVLQGSLDLGDYLETFRRHGIVFCEDAIQVGITGEGIIDARGTQFYDATQNHTYPEFDRLRTRQGEGYLPEGEFYTDGPIKRLPKPGMTLAFFHCNQVSLQGFTLKDTPSWAVRLAYCDDALVDGITILNNLLVPNSDGVHCTTSRNVRITHCDIRAGDDAIIITGFSTEESSPGYSAAIQEAHTYGNKTPYAENVIVSHCHLQSRSAGIRVGYGQHPIRRCTFSNIQIYGSNRGIGVFAHDASDIEDLLFDNIQIETRLHNGQWWGNAEPIHLSCMSRFEDEPAGQIKRVRFSNIMATSEHGILIYGLKDSPLEDIAFDKLRIRLRRGQETLAYGGNFDLRPVADIRYQLFEHDIPGIYAQYVHGLRLEDVQVKWEKDLPAFFTHALECLEVQELVLDGFKGKANPACETCLPIRLTQTSLADN